MPDIHANDGLPGDAPVHPADRATCMISYYKEQNGDIFFRALIDVDEQLEHVVTVYRNDYRDPYTDVLFACDCGADHVGQGSNTYDETWKTLSERHAECMAAALDHIHAVMATATIGD